MTQEKMSLLRARMIEDMRIRGMAETSQTRGPATGMAVSRPEPR